MTLFLQGLDDLARHVIFVVLSEHGFGLEGPTRLDVALGDDALPFAEQVGRDTWKLTGMSLLPSVTSKRTCRLSPRSRLPIFTMPPRRTRLPGAALFSAMSVGELKNTINSRSEPRISATAKASTPRLEPIG